ncbi:MAG TPA: HAD family hydrolase [Nitrososphaerales archaeon]|nr:HAD family hydrolase [Nitrososphaerales archaeon]
MPVGVIFDIDGTLVTFRFDVQGTRKALLGELTARGFETAGLGLVTPTQQIIDAARSQAPSGKPEAFEELRLRIYDILDEFELESVESAIVFPGTRECLDSLRAKGVRMAVVTNSGRKAALKALGRAGLLDFFEFVLTRDDTETMKPRPEGLLKATSMLGLPADSVYYVGDSPYDIAAAKNAGIKVVSVATGNYSIEHLRDEGADRVISSITELRDVFGL